MKEKVYSLVNYLYYISLLIGFFIILIDYAYLFGNSNNDYYINTSGLIIINILVLVIIILRFHLKRKKDVEKGNGAKNTNYK